MGEREDSWRVAVGAGSPAGPDTVAGDEGPPPTDVVQAVADFVEDLVEDPTDDEATPEGVSESGAQRIERFVQPPSGDLAVDPQSSPAPRQR